MSIDWVEASLVKMSATSNLEKNILCNANLFYVYVITHYSQPELIGELIKREYCLWHCKTPPPERLFRRDMSESIGVDEKRREVFMSSVRLLTSLLHLGVDI